MVLYKCDRCGKIFKLRGDWRRHKNRKRLCTPNSSKKSFKNAPKHKCPNCGKLYTTKYNLNRHLQHSCKDLEVSKNMEQVLEQIEESDKQLTDSPCNDMNNREIDGNSDIENFKSSFTEDLSSQQEDKSSQKEDTKMECDYCKRHITKKNISRHKKKCVRDKKYKLEEKEKEYQEKLKEKDTRLKEKEEEIKELREIEQEYLRFMKEMARQNSGNTINNNINMFYIINNYKNAQNFEVLMGPELTQKERDYVLKNGPINGSYKLLQGRCIDGIKTENRPFHCVDDSRNKYLLYSENDWSVDRNGAKILREVYGKVRGVYDTTINRGDSMAVVYKKADDIGKLFDLEKIW